MALGSRRVHVCSREARSRQFRNARAHVHGRSQKHVHAARSPYKLTLVHERLQPHAATSMYTTFAFPELGLLSSFLQRNFKALELGAPP